MVLVTKQSGELEEFRPEKVENALIRAGVNRGLAADIISEVTRRLYDGITTDEIYGMAFRLLDEHDDPAATRYGLKRAIMRLGPSGFPFEKFFSKVLEAYGFKTAVNQKMRGACVEQEVDIVAEDGRNRYMIECKYHNSQGVYTGLKEAMYTFARFQDLVDGGNDFTVPWLVCNTKCSSEAIKYGKCKGMNLTSWGYPPKGSLQELIDNKRVYPVTILRSVDDGVKNKLASSGIILARDLMGRDFQGLKSITGLSERKLKDVLKEVEGILV